MNQNGRSKVSIAAFLVQPHTAGNPPPNYVPRVIIQIHHARYLQLMDIIIAV